MRPIVSIEVSKPHLFFSCRTSSLGEKHNKSTLYVLREYVLFLDLFLITCSCLCGPNRNLLSSWKSLVLSKILKETYFVEMTTPGFEGAEKILQIKIESVKPNNKGLRAIPQSTWQLILKEAKCSIINSIYSESESTLSLIL